MADTVKIPRGYLDDETAPAWIAVIDSSNRYCKPVIRCQCGTLTGIGLHRVAADGTVTASFLHDRPPGEGCGWHVFLILDGYREAVEKAQGLKKGEKVVRIRKIRVVSVRRERLDAITPEDVRAEGFPGDSPEMFVNLFCMHNDTSPQTEITRIEFAYI